MTERATEVIADRGCGAVIGKLTQTGLVCTGYCRIIGKTAGYSTTKKSSTKNWSGQPVAGVEPVAGVGY